MQYQAFKKCPVCGETMGRDQFSTRRSGGLSSYCKMCQAQYCRAHYLRGPKKQNARRYQNSLKYIRRNRAYVADYLRSHHCIDCGERDPVVLEFDHIGKKTENIAIISSRGVALSKVIAEIEQCVIRCANCHRRRTARQLGWKK